MEILDNNHTPEWIFENVVPLAPHFNIEAGDDNPYYELDILAVWIKEHIKQGQVVVYPLPKTGVMPHGNLKYFLNKLNSLGIITKGIFVSGSADGCQEPIPPDAIKLCPSLFDAFARLSVSDMYLRFVNTLYNIFDLSFGVKGEDVIQAVYTELSKLNTSIPYTTAEPKRLFGIVYREAMGEVYRWLKLNSALFSAYNEHSEALQKSLIGAFLYSLDQIGTQIDEEKLLSMTEDAIVWENVIIWFHLGYFVLHLKEPRLAYNRFIDCAPFRSFTKDQYMELIKSAQEKSSKIVAGTADATLTDRLKLPDDIGNLITKKPILDRPSNIDDGTGRKEIADAITRILGTGRIITQSDISFFIPSKLVAMCSYEYGSKNFAPEASSDDEFNVKYYYIMNGHRFVLFTIKGYDDTVYGWSVDGPKTLIMLSGDKGYDYKLVVDEPEVSDNYK
jgi:hypothetical protein